MIRDKKELPRNLFSFIWHFSYPYTFIVLIFVGLAICGGFYGPFNSLLMKKIINLLPQVHPSNTSLILLPASLIVINFLIFDNFVWRAIGYIRCKFIPIIIKNITRESTDYALEKSPHFYQENLSGKISKQINNLTDGIEKITSSVVPNFLRGTSLLVTAFIAAYFVNPIFSFILIVWFMLFAGVSITMSRKLASLSNTQASAESIVVGELVDSLANHSNIRIFSRKSYENSRMVQFLEKQQKAYTATYFYAVIMHSVQGLLIATMIGFSCYFLVYLYSQQTITVGDFSLILGLSIETGHMMWFTMGEVDEFYKAVGRCNQSLSSLMVPVEIQDKPDAVPLKCDRGQIIFDKVRFDYKGGKTLFQNKSVEIKGGQKVGLVGYSGGGKSTFINLILRLYDVTEGAILIDGQDIKNVTQDSLRENIAVIPQEPTLFNRTLMDNIRYGRIDATDEEIIDAAKKASAHDFIAKLQQGYDTPIGAQGVKLSGGQSQRIAIARAILKNAPILILDEATSQLDAVVESVIQNALLKLMQNKTTIVIAHRLSTLLHMDRILVFDQGNIAEDGTHIELLALNGIYKTMWDAQLGGFLPGQNLT